MNTLREDLDEFDSESGRRWVRRQRRKYGIKPDEATCWFVVTEQSWTDGRYDHNTEGLFSSPADAIDTAEGIAGNAHSRQGLGRWILEVYGDEVNLPRYLLVRPVLDEDHPD